MKNFAKALLEHLTGPPQTNQSEFSDQIGLDKSKVSRILRGNLQCDRPTLDVVLSGIKTQAGRQKLVLAYIKDTCSPAALANLSDKPDPTSDLLTQLRDSKLSAKGQTALRALLRSDQLHDVEKIFIDLYNAFGLD